MQTVPAWTTLGVIITMKLIKTLIFIFIYSSTSGQDSTSIFLHSWKHQNRVDKISTNQYLSLDLEYSDSLEIHKIAPKSYSGRLLFIKNNVLFMTVDQEESSFQKVNGTKKDISIYYTFPDSLKKVTDGEIKKINLDRITSLSYTKQKPLSNIGFFIAGFSVLSALVIAPIASVNFKNGDFRQVQYYKILGGCAAGFTIGLPLGLIFQKNRTYYIKSNPPDTDDMQYFYFSDK